MESVWTVAGQEDLKRREAPRRTTVFGAILDV
jgi:hypothetical protein